MREKRKRPAIVWAMQIILGLVSLMLVLMWFVALSARAQGGTPAAMFWTFFVGGAINLIFVIPSIGLFMNKPWGRWSSIVVLGFFTALLTVGQFLRIIYDISTLPPGPQKSGYMFGSLIGAVIFCGTPAYVVFRMATSDRVCEFFSPTEEPGLAVPPPPTFEENIIEDGQQS